MSSHFAVARHSVSCVAAIVCVLSGFQDMGRFLHGVWMSHSAFRLHPAHRLIKTATSAVHTITIEHRRSTASPPAPWPPRYPLPAAHEPHLFIHGRRHPSLLLGGHHPHRSRDGQRPGSGGGPAQGGLPRRAPADAGRVSPVRV